jgi:transposase-like protein
MAEIEGEQSLTSDWVCPNCGIYYRSKKIGLTIHSFWPRYRFCEKECGRYFNIKDEDITEFITNRRRLS